MADPKWLAKDKVLTETGGGEVVWNFQLLAEFRGSALKRAHTHIDELREMLIDVLNGYTRLAIEKNRPEVPRAHALADALLYREEPPAGRRGMEISMATKDAVMEYLSERFGEKVLDIQGATPQECYICGKPRATVVYKTAAGWAVAICADMVACEVNLALEKADIEAKKAEWLDTIVIPEIK